MTDEKLLESWRAADCPLTVERVGEGVKVGGKDALDFVVLAPKAVLQLIKLLQEAVNG